MEPQIEGVNYHRRWWKTTEWWGGVCFLLILGLCFWRGMDAGVLAAWLALGLNLYVVGRMFYKRGRAMMDSSKGETHALAIQFLFNATALLFGKESPEEVAMWSALAYGIFCLCRGLAKQRVK